MKMKVVVFIIAAACGVIGCGNPFMENLLGPKPDKHNIEDFGKDASIATIVVDSDSWRNTFSGLSPGNYVANLREDINLGGDPAITLGVGVRVSLRGNKTIKRSTPGAGALFKVGKNQKLVLRGPALKGENFDELHPNKASLVEVNGGTLEMRSGEISGNYLYSGSGADTGSGVSVKNGGAFTMYGGSISGNSGFSCKGLGVYVEDGIFTMNGGNISGNMFGDTGGSGVFIESGAFIMNSGNISHNFAEDGGGVFFNGGAFTMNGGNIFGNTGGNAGGGVVVRGGAFTMNGGNISQNTAQFGSGVVVSNIVRTGIFTTFTMNNGNIFDNTATGSYFGGGGVHVLAGGLFLMRGGSIHNNIAANTSGGGVYVGNSYPSYAVTFCKTGGTIRDNTAGTGLGHAAYAEDSAAKYRNASAGPEVKLYAARDHITNAWSYSSPETGDTLPAWPNM